VTVCAAVLGNVTVTPGLLYPILIGIGSPGTVPPGLTHQIDILIGNQTQVIHTFTVSFPLPGCVHVDTSPTVGPGVGNGTLKGYCGHSSGTGTIGGEQFAYVSAGTFLILTGHVVGLASAIPVPLTGSCLHADGPTTVQPSNPFRLATGGATEFIVSGAGVGLNCLNTLTPTQTLVQPVNTLLLTQPVGIHFGLGVHLYTMGTCTPSLNHLP